MKRKLNYCKNKRPLNLILELTNNCNMRCLYCFEKDCKVDFTPKKMSTEVLIKSLDYLFSNNNSNVHITFFGGEPLLCKDLINNAIRYSNDLARKNKIFVNYSIVTNAVLLDKDTINFLNKHNVNIVVSFDGLAEIQNKYRPLANGHGSYDTVIKNIKTLLNSRKNKNYGHTLIRPTITLEGIFKLTEIYNTLINLGATEISFALVSAKETDSFAINYNCLDVLKNEYEKLANIYLQELKTGVSNNKFFESLIQKINNGLINNFFCDCGERYIAINTEGNIYPCEGFIGIDKFMCGNILKNEFIDTDFYIESTNTNSTCRSCWAKQFCGGSCYHEAWMRTNSLNNRDKIVCETYKISIEVALELYFKLKSEGLLTVLSSLKSNDLPFKSIPILNKEKYKLIKNNMYIPKSDDFVFLEVNELTKEILNLCDGKNSIVDITNSLLNKYESTFNIIFNDVSELLNNLINLNIISLTI